mgnify:CR=1 FL=1
MEVRNFIESVEKGNVIVEESFVNDLKRSAKLYQKKNSIRRLEEVYSLIGVKKEYIYYWEKHLFSTQQKKL